MSVKGYVSRAPSEAKKFIDGEPVTRFIYNVKYMPGNASLNTSGLDPSVLSHYNIRYVIVHQESLTPQQAGLIATLFNNTSQTPLVYKKDRWLCTRRNRRHEIRAPSAALPMHGFMSL